MGHTLARLRTLLRGVGQRQRANRELDDERRFHVGMETQSNIDSGMSAAEARRVALRDPGGVEQTKEAVHDVRTIWLDSLVLDVRLGLRMLRRSPVFATVTLLSLALGIGVNLAIFNFVNALFLSPLPGVAEPDNLVTIHHRVRAGGSFTSASYPDYDYYRQHASSFAGVVAYTSSAMTVRGSDEAETVRGELVSDNYFQVLAARPTIGRLLDAQDSLPGADPAIVLSYEWWQSRFGGDMGIVGSTVHVGTTVASVVGVGPRRFRGLTVWSSEPPSLWVPVSLYRQAVPSLGELFGPSTSLLTAWSTQTFSLAARLKPGTRMREAVVEMATIAPRLDRERAAAWNGPVPEYASLDVVLVQGRHARVSPGERGTIVWFLKLLATVTILIFLVACLNVANLIYARAGFREHEIAVRSSLGASWWRVVRQLLTENLTLSALATIVSFPVAFWTSRVLTGFGPASPMSFGVLEMEFDGRVIAFAGAMAVLTGVLVTLLPARVAARASISHALGRRSRGFASGLGAQSFLVGVQVALSVVLVIGAGLFVRTLKNALAVDVTVRSDRVLLANLNPRAAGIDPERAGILYTQFLDRVRALPGVVNAAQVMIVPLGGRRGGTNIELPSNGATNSRHEIQVGFNAVSAGYFQTVGLPLSAGRDFTDADRAGSPPVAVVNQVMVDRLFSGRNPIGVRLAVKWRPESVVEVIGVVRDGKFKSYSTDAEPTFYVPLGQRYVSPITLEVRTAGNPLTLVPAIRRELAVIDGNLPLTGIRTARTHFETELWRERLTATLLSAIGVLALALAAIGIYGILSFAVAQRTWEIGVRMALGARPASVLSLVLGRLLGVVAAGAAAGALGAAALTRAVRGLLYQVSPTDPVVILSGVTALVAVALVASFVPARRAASVDPVKALRSE